MAAPEVQQDDGPPLTELESLQLKANQVTDESLESTRRMITLCEDAQGVGAKTLQMLDHQGEQLNIIEKDVENMNVEIKKAEKHLSGMEKWCGCFSIPWRRQKKIKDLNLDVKKEKNKGFKVSSKSETKPASEEVYQKKGNFIKRINGDAREDEMEENMVIVTDILSNLKNMSTDMGTEIDKHNQQIDCINLKSQTVDTRISSANERTQKLLK